MRTTFAIFAAVLAATLGFGATAAPNQAPTVSITSPANGTSFTAPATIVISATANDPDGTVTQVEFFDGTVSIGRDTAAPFTVTWTGATPGTHSITAKATDNASKTTTSAAIQVTVINITTTITSPAANAVVQSGFVFVQGTYSGPDTTTVIVTAGAGHSVVANNSAGAFGANVLVARGAQNIEVQVARRDGTSETINRPVTGISAPVVAMVAPSFTGPYTSPAPVTLTAQAASLDANIQQVEFYDGSTRLGAASAPPYSFAATLSGTGSHGIFARAIDQYGFITDSRAITLTTQSAPPVVSITAPANGVNVRTPGSVTFTATASDPDGNVSVVDYMEGTSRLGGASVAPYSFVWPNPPVGSHDIVARATDNSGALGYSSVVRVNVFTNVPPSVQLTLPADNATFRAPATVNFAATAADTDGNVNRVEFLLNGSPAATDSTSPYEGTKLGVTAGTYTVIARAFDNDGAFSDSTRTINVAGNASPTVSITSPANNASFNAPTSVAITAAAADSDGNVTGVEFFVDGASIGTSPGPTFSATWANATVGSHTLTAIARDSDGATTPSAPITITVNGITAAITAPANNSNYVAPAAYDVTATVSTSSGVITSIEWYDGPAKIATTTVPPPGAATVNAMLNLSAVAAGPHVYTVKGFDSGSRTATSAAITVNVAPAPAPPTVSLDSPAPNAFFVAPAFMRLSASAAAGGYPLAKVEFFAGSTLIGTATSAPYSVPWSNVPAASYALTAKATDTNGGNSTTAPVSINVAAAPTASVAPGIDGSTVTNASLLVSGTVQAPANSSISVGGAVGTLLPDGRFFANNVALSQGVNTIPVVVTAQDGQTSTQSITVNGAVPSPFSVTASPSEGVVPLTVLLSVHNPDSAAFATIEFDFDLDGTADFVAATIEQAQAQITLTSPGLQHARVVVKDAQGAVLYTSVQAMYGFGPVQRFQVLRGVYDGVLLRLKTGNIDSSLPAFSPLIRDLYAQAFNALGSSLGTVVDQLGSVTAGGVIGMNYGELVITRQTPQGPRGFIVTIIRDVDGIWRIDGM